MTQNTTAHSIDAYETILFEFINSSGVLGPAVSIGENDTDWSQDHWAGLEGQHRHPAGTIPAGGGGRPHDGLYR